MAWFICRYSKQNIPHMYNEISDCRKKACILLNFCKNHTILIIHIFLTHFRKDLQMNHTKRPCCRYTAGLLLSVAFCPFPSTRGKRFVLEAFFMQKNKGCGEIIGRLVIITKWNPMHFQVIAILGDYQIRLCFVTLKTIHFFFFFD